MENDIDLLSSVFFFFQDLWVAVWQGRVFKRCASHSSSQTSARHQPSTKWVTHLEIFIEITPIDPQLQFFIKRDDKGYHRKEISKLTFRALALRQNECR